MTDATPDPPFDPLSTERRRLLLELARRAIEGVLRGGGPWGPIDDPVLLRPRAAFVTLRRRDSGALRGCRGESAARRALTASVAAGAVGAATDDPRFPPVRADELGMIRIEVSALTAPRPIRPEQVEIGRHGLMIARDRHRGLLLPQVPARHGLDVEGFLDALCRKAGLPRGSWRDNGPDPCLFGFEAEVWGEDGVRRPRRPGE